MSRFPDFARRTAAATLAMAGLAVFPPLCHAVLTLSGGGLSLVEQGGTFAPTNLAGASLGAFPFSSSDLGVDLSIPFHRAVNINDEIYGNSNSWIGGNSSAPYPLPFAGVALDGSYTLQSIAFGRDNSLVALPDRSLGLYTLQYTTVLGPAAGTLDADWTTIGTLNYGASSGGNYSLPQARHRYNFTPLANVTGVRLLVPGTGIGGGGTAIDELELYEAAGAFVPPPPNVVLTPSAGLGIGFNGNNGPSVPADPALVPDNFAHVDRGADPFASSELGPQIGSSPTHDIATINDGQYGNRNSWIGATGDTNPFVGVALDGPVYVSSIAWGRDNGNISEGGCAGGTCPDRTPGVYTIQYTQLVGATELTPETGDPATGWASVGTVEYRLSEPGVFDQYLRHEFTVSEEGNPILASGIRLKVPLSGLAAGTAIDELEVYGAAIPEPSSVLLGALGLGGMFLLRKRRA